MLVIKEGGFFVGVCLGVFLVEFYLEFTAEDLFEKTF
jgi:glutamine amidotransferase-like uncharacterized protein